MNHIELDNQAVEIVFENCETINIDMWAIKSLTFDTVCDRYIWDEQHKNFITSTIITDIKMVFDIRDWKDFHHTARLIDTKTLKEDGEKCIDRLRFSDDITHIVINGKSFTVPWKRVEAGKDSLGIPWYKNVLQKNTESTNTHDGHQLLTIEVKGVPKECME